MVGIRLLGDVNVLIEWKKVLMLGGDVGGEGLAIVLDNHAALKFDFHFDVEDLERICMELAITIHI